MPALFPTHVLRAFGLASLSLSAAAACNETFRAADQGASAGAAGDAGDTGDTGETQTAGSGGDAGSGEVGDGGMGGTAGSAATGGAGGSQDAGAGGQFGGAAGVAGGDAGAAGDFGDACPYEMCGGNCIDVDTDSNHCGSCDYACVGGRTCDVGVCTPGWIVMNADGAPAARIRHAAVWDGSTFLTTGGGVGGIVEGTKTGGRYDPASDRWSVAPPMRKARCGHALVRGPDSTFAYGGIADCRNGTTTVDELEKLAGAAWAATEQRDEPDARYSLSAVWVSGGILTYGGSSKTEAYTSIANWFDPTSGSWRDLSCSTDDCPRGGRFSAFVDGAVVHVWGGAGAGGTPLPYGMTYNPVSDQWTRWEPLPVGTPMTLDQIANSGEYVYSLRPGVDGSNHDSACDANVEVAVYDKAAGVWRRGPTAPRGMSAAAAVAWSGREFIAWSGQCGTSASEVGARYQPPADVGTLPALAP